MNIKAATIDEYLAQVPEERKEVFEKLRAVINENIPAGFHEELNYGMIGYVVPHALYPKGYHVTPSAPLPFVAIASQKNFIALYHMGLYANVELMEWFEQQYKLQCKTKLDCGKSCIRFKKLNDIPFALIGELMQKISVQQYIETYEQTINKIK